MGMNGFDDNQKSNFTYYFHYLDVSIYICVHLCMCHFMYSICVHKHTQIIIIKIIIIKQSAIKIIIKLIVFILNL